MMMEYQKLSLSFSAQKYVVLLAAVVNTTACFEDEFSTISKSQ